MYKEEELALQEIIKNWLWTVPQGWNGVEDSTAVSKFAQENEEKLR